MISPLIDDLLRAAVESGASDLLLHSGKTPQARLDGELVSVTSGAVTETDLEALWKFCGAEPEARDFDAAITGPDGGRFRVNLLRQLGARAAVLRRIRSDVPNLESLGLPADLLREWTARRSGIVLISGPTGSGKSTTVAAALDWLNGTSARHIVTIEDPVEFVFQPRLSTFTQREVGIDTASFAEGLRRSLRQNPDVIFLGEIRDADSAATAIQAAETGHLVFATLHASNAADVISRLELLFPPGEREGLRKALAVQLLGVLCQRLIPAVTGGLALVCEFFSNSGSSRKIIMEGRGSDLPEFIARGDPLRARSFADALLQMVRAGRISEADASENAENPQELSRLLRGINSSTQSRR